MSESSSNSNFIWLLKLHFDILYRRKTDRQKSTFTFSHVPFIMPVFKLRHCTCNTFPKGDQEPPVKIWVCSQNGLKCAEGLKDKHKIEIDFEPSLLLWKCLLNTNHKCIQTLVNSDHNSIHVLVNSYLISIWPLVNSNLKTIWLLVNSDLTFRGPNCPKENKIRSELTRSESTNVRIVHVKLSDNSDLGRLGPWSIRTFSVDNSDLGQLPFGQFGHRPLVNWDLDHWSISTSSIGQFGPQHSVLWMN